MPSPKMTRLSWCGAAGCRWTLRGVCLTFTWHTQGRGTQTDRMSGLFVCWSRLAHGLWGYRRSVSTDPAASQAHKSQWVDGCIQHLTEDSVYVSLATHLYERRMFKSGSLFFVVVVFVLQIHLMETGEMWKDDILDQQCQESSALMSGIQRWAAD